MEIKTISEEFIRRMDAELKYNSKSYHKVGEPFSSQELSTMAVGSLPPVDLWHGLWYQGEMACLFGEPNVGKTILAMQIANELSKRGLKTLYFDFENAAHQFKARYSTEKYDDRSGDASFIVKPLNPNYSTAPLDSRSILDYIKKDFITERAPVIIIDDITHLIGSGDQADVRHVLNTLRSWTQHFLVSILVLAHSKRRRPSSLTTIESLAGSFEYSYAFDSIFSLTRANRYNAENKGITHYIKHHKNRMGPVYYNELNVITAQFGRDESNGFLQFNELYTGGNERQLLRDNGYKTSNEVRQAIIQYHNLHFSTREIAEIVSCSQSLVCKVLRQHEVQQEKSTTSVDSTDSMLPSAASLSPLPSKIDQTEDVALSSPSKIDQWCKPNADVELAQPMLRCSPLPLEERDTGGVCQPMIKKDKEVCTLLPATMPRTKLEPVLTPIYDESQYTLDPYGQRCTMEEYNLYYSEETEQENSFNPFADDDYQEDEFDDDDDYDDDEFDDDDDELKNPHGQLLL